MRLLERRQVDAFYAIEASNAPRSGVLTILPVFAKVAQFRLPNTNVGQDAGLCAATMCIAGHPIDDDEAHGLDPL
jgi:hypothetical protein